MSQVRGYFRAGQSSPPSRYPPSIPPQPAHILTIVLPTILPCVRDNEKYFSEFFQKCVSWRGTTLFATSGYILMKAMKPASIWELCKQTIQESQASLDSWWLIQLSHARHAILILVIIRGCRAIFTCSECHCCLPINGQANWLGNGEGRN